jgi:hypothetical protein
MANKFVTLAAGALLACTAFSASAQEPIIDQTEVTIVGCVERGKDYRTKKGASIVGVDDNDIIVTDAKAMKPARMVGLISGDFGLTGRLHTQLTTEVGRPVQISGVVEDLMVHRSSKGRVSLRKLFIRLWQPAAGTCS